MRLSSPGLFSFFVMGWVAGCYLADCHLLTVEYGLRQATIIDSACHYWFELLSLSLLSFCLAFLGARPASAMIALVVPLLGFTYALLNLPEPGPNDLFYNSNQDTIEVTVLVEETGRASGAQVRVLSTGPYREVRSIGKVLLQTRSNSAIKLVKGAVYRVTGKVAKFKKIAAPWEFDLRGFLRRKRIFCRLKAQKIELLKPAKESLFVRIDSLRTAIIETHRKELGRDRGDLLSSIVLGDRAVDLPRKIKEDFRKTGLSHLLAASGFNLSILVGTIYFLMGRISRSRMKASLASIVAITGFVSLAGTSASVTRAATMGVLLVLSRAFYRRTNSSSILSLTLLAFSLLDPVALTDVGLQLSYAATYGIILGVEPIHNYLKKLETGPVIRFILELFAVILLAQGAVLPIQLYYFWELGLSFILANMLLDPAVAPVTIGGFVSSFLVLISKITPVGGEPLMAVACLIDRSLSFPLDFMLKAASILASQKNNLLSTGQPAPSAIIFYATTYLFLLSQLKNKHTLPLCSALFSLALCLLLFAPFACLSSRKLVLASRHELACVKGRELTAFMAGRRKASTSMARCLKFHGINPELIRESKTIFEKMPMTPFHLALYEGENKFIQCGKAEVMIEKECYGTSTLITVQKIKAGLILRTCYPQGKSLKIFKHGEIEVLKLR